MRITRFTLLLAAALLAMSTPVQAQAVDPDPIAVGTMAPDFSLPAATRHGILRDPVQLSELRGQAVVLAFFYRARTRG